MDFSEGNILEMFMEVHPKHQSRMNQAWEMNNIFLLKPQPLGLWQFNTYEVLSSTTITKTFPLDK